MKKIKATKAAKPISGSARAAKIASPVKLENATPAQAIQGQMGKAQGYLGKFAGQTPAKGGLLSKAAPKKKKGPK